jgi:hypothetical protein
MTMLFYIHSVILFDLTARNCTILALFFLSYLFILSAMSLALERLIREDLVPHQMKISLPASRRNTWDKSRELATVSTWGERRKGGREKKGER